MLKDIISTERSLHYHLNTQIGPYLDKFLDKLEEQGFAKSTIHASRTTTFSYWISPRIGKRLWGRIMRQNKYMIMNRIA